MKQTNVPDGWKEVKLGDCCFVTDGDHLPPPKTETGIPFIVISNIHGFNQLSFSQTMFVPIEYYNNIIEIRKTRKNDILYTVVGSYGTPVLIKNNIRFCFQRHIALVRPEQVVPEYLLQVMDSIDFHKQADAAAVGEAQKTVSLASLRNMSFLIPTEVEQKEIAGTLSVWDNMIEKMEQLIARKEEKRIWLSNKLIANNLNRKTWKQIKLKEILHEGSKIPVSDTNLYNKITIKLHKNGLCFSDNTREMADTRPFYVRHTGELIIGKQNYFNGSIALVDKQFDGAICSNAIMSFVISDEVDKNFLYEAISYNSYLEKHAALANGTGQKELSENDFLNFEILIPSINEQHKIADLISSDQKEIDLLKQLIGQYKLQKQGLMQKLLTGQWRIK